MYAGLSTQPRTRTALARAATTSPLGSASPGGLTVKPSTPYPRPRRPWPPPWPNGPPTACHRQRSAWTVQRFGTITPKPDTRTQPIAKGCAGCCADSPAGRRARVAPRDRPPPSRRRVWPRSVRLPICGARDRAGQRGPRPRSGGYRARMGHAGRHASALGSSRAHLGRRGVSERTGRPASPSAAPRATKTAQGPPCTLGEPPRRRFGRSIVRTPPRKPGSSASVPVGRCRIGSPQQQRLRG